jgi:hypothetical protein
MDMFFNEDESAVMLSDRPAISPCRKIKYRRDSEASFGERQSSAPSAPSPDLRGAAKHTPFHFLTALVLGLVWAPPDGSRLTHTRRNPQ